MSDIHEIRPQLDQPRVAPVRKAYEQAADQLLELILSGALPPGTRLPNETVLAHQFGVSRATVREALRQLAAQNLVRTVKGAAGGTYVTLPTIDHISDFLSSSITVLTQAHDVTLEEFLEARELLEVPAVRLAASRRSDDDLERLREAIPHEPLRLDTQEQFIHNRRFHSVLMETCRNSLLYVAAQPVFSILQTNLARAALGRRFHLSVNEHHREIVAAVDTGDADAAGEAMREHLHFLRPAYERAWKHAFRASPRRRRP